jgi:hypothetical protein
LALSCCAAAILAGRPAFADQRLPTPQKNQPELPPARGTPRTDSCPDTTVGESNDALIERFLREQAPARQQEPPKCTVSRERVELLLDARGEIVCRGSRLDEVPDTARIVVLMTVPAALADRYRLRMKLGDEAKGGIQIHGSWDNASAAASKASAALAKLRAATFESGAPNPLDSFVLEREFGPYRDYDSTTLDVTLADSTVSARHGLKIEHPYPLGLAVLGVLSSSTTTYAVTDGLIRASEDKLPASFFVGVHWYFAAWSCCRNGRMFLSSGPTLRERVSLTVGVRAPDPSSGAYAGLSVEVLHGIMVTVGAQARKEPRLKDGFVVGQAVSGTAVPTDQGWSFAPAAGLSLPADVVTRLLGSLK